MLSYEKGLRMAQWMKKEDKRIQRAIRSCEAKGHGVVALRFSNEARVMRIEILDEPYDGNVRIYLGEE